jgi:hypothetical protein
MKSHQAIFGGFVLGYAIAVHPATYHVSQRHPEASDESRGSAEQPWLTLTRAAEAVRSGDSVIITGGIYREHVRVKASGTPEAPIRFEAAAGEHVVLTGADHLTNWEKASDASPIHHRPWPHRFVTWNAGMTHPDDAYHRVIGRCEQVWVNGYHLRQVLEHERLAPGTFFADVTNQTLYVWDTAGRELGTTHVEASTRPEIFRVEGEHVHLRGLRFRYAANMAQRGAVVLVGRHGLMEDCVIEMVNASGATFRGEDLIIRRCVFRDNGQLGFGASRAHRLLLTECLIENNNTKGFDRGWEAGGNKLALCRDVVLERSAFLRNRGNGIWFDIGNTNCVVRHCLIADNEDAGIFYEISFALHAHDNVLVGNGFAATRGAWGAQAGISLSSSPNSLVERNLIAGNREGFSFREQRRTTPTIEDRAERPVWNHDNVIRSNLIVLNRDAQVWGWFDVADDRHWPGTESPRRGEPQQMNLQALRLQFVGNIYSTGPGHGLFRWGTPWRRRANYSSLDEFRSALGIDIDGRVMEPRFAGFRQLDMRLPAEAFHELAGAYPREPVPGVKLGPLP